MGALFVTDGGAAELYAVSALVTAGTAGGVPLLVPTLETSETAGCAAFVAVSVPVWEEVETAPVTAPGVAEALETAWAALWDVETWPVTGRDVEPV